MGYIKKTEIETKLKKCEQQLAKLQKGYSAVLEFSDKMEQLTQFQDKIDVPSSSIDQIWDIFLEDIRQLINTEVCSLFLVDEESHEFMLQRVAPHDQGTVCQDEVAFQIEYGMFSWVIRRKKPAIVPSLVFKNQKTIIMLPLCTARRTHGMVIILTPIEESSITQENLRLLTMLARQCSLVIENTLLYDKLRSKHDSLQKAQAQILQSEKLASVGRLTAGAFHEILNPLNIISGYVQLLLMDTTVDSRLSRYLSIMRDQCDRIARIVKGLLEFSRFPKQKKGTVKINDLIERVFALVEYEIKFDSIRIAKELDHTVPLIVGDEEKLSQVFFNLFYNAWDSMPQGGALKVSTSVRTDDNHEPGQQGWITVVIEDNGCGIPREHLSKIFDPFFTTRSEGGRIGLGLSLSYGIIQEHGGRIEIDSTLNKGTTVTVLLPC